MGNRVSVSEEQFREEPYERPFYPGLALEHQQQEEQQVQGAHNGKGCHIAHVGRQPEGHGQREVEHYGHDDEEEEHNEGQSLQQAHEFVNDVELQVFGLKPDVVLDDLRQLGYGLNVLVAR